MELPPTSLWHVTVTVAGEPVSAATIRGALRRLEAEHAFLVCARYAADRAEVRYWDEAVSVTDALELAAGLWAEHRGTARLPDWQVCGVEVVDRATYLRRAGAAGVLTGQPAGIVPF